MFYCPFARDTDGNGRGDVGGGAQARVQTGVLLRTTHLRFGVNAVNRINKLLALCHKRVLRCIANTAMCHTAHDVCVPISRVRNLHMPKLVTYIFNCIFNICQTDDVECFGICISAPLTHSWITFNAILMNVFALRNIIRSKFSR